MKFTSMIMAAMFAFFLSGISNAEASQTNGQETMTVEVQGGDKTTLTVYGKCGMCENRIEKTANKLDGVSKADWDKATQKLTITYNADKVDMMKVHKALAEVGHDTKKVEADDKTYQSLPACCKYERE